MQKLNRTFTKIFTEYHLDSLKVREKDVTPKLKNFMALTTSDIKKLIEEADNPSQQQLLGLQLIKKPLKDRNVILIENLKYPKDSKLQHLIKLLILIPVGYLALMISIVFISILQEDKLRKEFIQISIAVLKWPMLIVSTLIVLQLLLGKKA